MTLAERLMLFNQYDILIRLCSNDHDKRNYQAMQKIVLRGHTGLYEFLYEQFSAESSAEIFDDVRNILDMFRAINKFLIENKINASDCNKYGKNLVFRGFDANNEAEHYSVAEMLINDLERFEDLRPESFNSHGFPSLETYKSMVRAWKSLPEKKRDNLEEADIAVICGSTSG